MVRGSGGVPEGVLGGGYQGSGSRTRTRTRTRSRMAERLPMSLLH